jgi:hypothetical protein
MNAATRNILWQLWRMTRFEIAVTLLGVYGFIGVMVAVAQARGSNTVLTLAAPFLFLLLGFLAMVTVVSPSWGSFQSKNNPSNLFPFPLLLDYVQPVRTFPLVFMCMTYVCLKTAGLYLLVAIPLRLFLGMPLPLLDFAAWLAVAAAFMQAAVWIPASTLGRALGYIFSFIAATVSLIMFLSKTPEGFDTLFESRENLRGMFHLTPYSCLWLVVIAAASLASATVSVEQQRHGERLLPRLFARGTVSARSRRRPARRFSGPVRAQVWCEVRRALIPSMLLPTIAAGLIVTVGLLVAFAVAVDSKDVPAPSQFGALWVLLTVPTFIATYSLTAHFSSALRQRGGTWSYSTFEATLPVETRSLTLIKLGVVLAGGVLTALLLALGTLIASLPYWGHPEWDAELQLLLRNCTGEWARCTWVQRIALVDLFFLWTFAIPFLLFSFAEISTAWPRRFNWLCGGLAADLVLGVALALFNKPVRPFVVLNTWILAAIVIGGAAWAVYRSLTRRYLDMRVFVAFTTLWLVYAAIWTSIVTHARLAVSPSKLAVELLLLFTPLLALAMPPIALAEHRHR